MIYIIQLNESDVYKIGISEKIKKRIQTLQSSNHQKLRIYKTFDTLYSKEIESLTHKEFKRFKVRGEWFKLKTDELDDLMFFIECQISSFDEQERLKTGIEMYK